jgi:hypothetical protein
MYIIRHYDNFITDYGKINYKLLKTIYSVVKERRIEKRYDE